MEVEDQCNWLFAVWQIYRWHFKILIFNQEIEISESWESADHLLTNIGQSSVCIFVSKKNKDPWLATFGCSQKLSDWAVIGALARDIEHYIRFVSSLAREQGVGRMLLNIAQTFLPLSGWRRGDAARPFTLRDQALYQCRSGAESADWIWARQPEAFLTKDLLKCLEASILFSYLSNCIPWPYFFRPTLFHIQCLFYAKVTWSIISNYKSMSSACLVFLKKNENKYFVLRCLVQLLSTMSLAAQSGFEFCRVPEERRGSSRNHRAKYICVCTVTTSAQCFDKGKRATSTARETPLKRKCLLKEARR